jgi:integrase
MARMRLKGLKAYHEPKSGRVYHYHRKTGTRLLSKPGTAQFFAEWNLIEEKLKGKPAAKPGSLGLIIAEYRASHPFLRLAPRTQQDYLLVLDWLLQLGSLEMASMTAPDIVKIRDKAHKSKKIRFANYVLAVLSVLFGFAIERGFALRNPVKDVKNIRKSSDAPKANRPWTRTELDAFQNAAPPALSLPFAIARWTGLRQGDILKLTKDAYDGKTIRVITAKRRIHVAVPIPEDLQKMLNDRLKLPGSVLCVNSRGEPWTESGFRASFFKLIRKLAKDGKVGKGLSFHGIRSTVATELREAGVDLRTIADLLGQNTEQMASHYSKDADVSANVKDAAEKLERARKTK